jgi:starch synthase
MNYGLPLIEEAMNFSNRCTTVSPTYALEISGEPAIAPHMSKFLGIRNGIDGDIWDPQVRIHPKLHDIQFNFVGTISDDH